MYRDPPTQIVEKHPAIILRCLNTRGGIVAVLGSNTCITMNATPSTPMIASNEMMIPLLHCFYQQNIPK